jgi:hypothetical protein
MHHYGVYGISLRSDIRLNYPEHPDPARVADVSIEHVDGLSLSHLLGGVHPQASGAWGEHALLPDGSIYLRWPELAEFVLSGDGGHIFCCAAAGAAAEMWQTYLLGQVLSFALVKKGIEPLHATAVVVNGRAVGFLGKAGQGKSTLAAAFVAAGHKVLSDDLLVLQETEHAVNGHPGPCRIKLFPDQAEHLLGINDGVAMNTLTTKLVIPLAAHQCQSTAVPICALYLLETSTSTAGPGTRLSRLHPRRALIALVTHTFNRVMVAPDRLRRQFDSAARLAARVPVKRLTYARTLANLGSVRDAVLADIDRLVSRF